VETEQFLSERAMGLEPTSRPWKGRVIAIIRRPHKFTLHIIANFQRKKRAKNKKNKKSTQIEAIASICVLF
jgi:hypothetical protein